MILLNARRHRRSLVTGQTSFLSEAVAMATRTVDPTLTVDPIADPVASVNLQNEEKEKTTEQQKTSGNSHFRRLCLIEDERIAFL